MVVVERATIDTQHLVQTRESSLAFPYAWWEALGNIAFSSPFLIYDYRLPRTVQAGMFTYRGNPARVIIMSDDSAKPIFDRIVNDGDVVYAEAPSINLIRLFALGGTLEDTWHDKRRWFGARGFDIGQWPRSRPGGTAPRYPLARPTAGRTAGC